MAGNMEYVKGGVAECHGVTFVQYIAGFNGIDMSVIVDSKD